MTERNFSLFDFCKKHADKVEVYDKETLDDEGKVIPFIEQAAIITHYLQLSKRGVELPYKEKAEKILHLWYDFVLGKDKNSGMASESSVLKEQYLFPDLFQAPFQAPRNPKFTFIDLFAGIGGFRMAA